MGRNLYGRRARSRFALHERLHRSTKDLLHADAAEAAWRLRPMSRPNGGRALGALRILVEAVP